MKNEFLQNFNSLLAVVLTADKKEQEKYYDAVNSNASDSKKLMAEANERIRKLRDVINRLKDFHFEMVEILEDVDISPDEVYEAQPATASDDVSCAKKTDKELIVKVCEALIVAKPFKFLSMRSRYVNIDPSNLEEPYEKLTNSMYVSIAEPADVVCKEILSYCGIEEHEYHLYYEGV